MTLPAYLENLLRKYLFLKKTKMMSRTKPTHHHLQKFALFNRKLSTLRYLLIRCRHFVTFTHFMPLPVITEYLQTTSYTFGIIRIYKFRVFTFKYGTQSAHITIRIRSSFVVSFISKLLISIGIRPFYVFFHYKLF